MANRWIVYRELAQLSFNLSPAQFLKSSRNSRFYRDIHTKMFKMTYNWQKFYTWTSNVVLEDFELNRIFQLLPSKIVTVEKGKTYGKKDGRQFRVSSVKEKYIVRNSMIRGVINSSSFRNPAKVKVLLYVVCVEAISLLHMEEKMRSIDTRTLQTISDMWIRDKDIWMQHNDKESYQFWCQVNDCKLRPKTTKSWAALFRFSG